VGLFRNEIKALRTSPSHGQGLSLFRNEIRALRTSPSHGQGLKN